MNKNTLYKILYYISFIVFLIIWTGSMIFIMNYGVIVNSILGITNVILTVLVTIGMFKKKLDKINILFPVVFLVFSIIMVILVFLMNEMVVFPYVHFNYYSKFVLINYLLLSIYTLLSFSKKKKSKKA